MNDGYKPAKNSLRLASALLEPRTIGGMKILIVDDERAVRESLRRALELEGYEVELASDGEEAL